MKKIARTLWAILAAGAVALAAGSCDTAVDEKEWAEETPTTYADLKGGSTGNVTAVFDFTKNYANLSTAEVTIEDDIEPSSGTGAKIVTGGKLIAKWSSGIQMKKNSITLATISTSPYFILSLDDTANVVITGRGAGSAEAARLIAVYAADEKGAATGDPLVYKDNLASGATNDKEFILAAAPKGDYIVYCNGSLITKIEANVKDSEIKVPAEVDGVEIFTQVSPSSNDADKGYTKGVYTRDYYLNNNGEKTAHNADGLSFALKGFEQKQITLAELGNSESVTGKESANVTFNDLTSSAEWFSSDATIATVSAGMVTRVGSGSVTIRGRVGRYMADIVLEDGDKATGIEISGTGLTGDTATIEAITEKLTLTCKTVEGEEITDLVTWESSDKNVATVSKGVVSALKAGTAVISASIKDGSGTEFKKSVTVTVTSCEKTVITLLDTTSEAFPAKGTALAHNVKSALAATSIEKADLTGLAATNVTMTALTFNEKMTLDSITSNKGESSYNGLYYKFETGAGKTTLLKKNTAAYWSATITVTPPAGKTVKLTNVLLDYQTSKQKAKLYLNKSDAVPESDSKASVGDTATTTTSSKTLWKLDMVNADGVEISEATKFVLYAVPDGDIKDNGDQIGIGNVKLFFEPVE